MKWLSTRSIRLFMILAVDPSRPSSGCGGGGSSFNGGFEAALAGWERRRGWGWNPSSLPPVDGDRSSSTALPTFRPTRPSRQLSTEPSTPRPWRVISRQAVEIMSQVLITRRGRYISNVHADCESGQQSRLSVSAIGRREGPRRTRPEPPSPLASPRGVPPRGPPSLSVEPGQRRYHRSHGKSRDRNLQQCHGRHHAQRYQRVKRLHGDGQWRVTGSGTVR